MAVALAGVGVRLVYVEFARPYRHFEKHGDNVRRSRFSLFYHVLSNAAVGLVLTTMAFLWFFVPDLLADEQLAPHCHSSQAHATALVFTATGLLPIVGDRALLRRDVAAEQTALEGSARSASASIARGSLTSDDGGESAEQ